MKEEYQYFVSYVGTYKKIGRSFGSGIFNMDKALETPEAIEEICEHIAKETKLTEIVITFFKLIRWN
jgi:hypothetical protein